MNKFKILIVSALVLFAFSCSNETETKENTESNTRAENKVTNTEVNPVKEDKFETNSVVNDAHEAFSYLQEIAIGNIISIKYNNDITTIYNKICRDLSKSDPLYYDEGPGAYATKVMKTKINPTGNEYIIVFDEGPSADPVFLFYKDGDFKQPAFSIAALNIVVPGNGSVYSSGHTNNMFNKRRKFKVENNKLKEIEQSFYYVGLKTKTLKPLTLYSSTQISNITANLPKDYSIEVLLNKRNTDLYLIKTDFGLAGWVKLENQFYGNQAIDKLVYAGD